MTLDNSSGFLYVNPIFSRIGIYFHWYTDGTPCNYAANSEELLCQLRSRVCALLSLIISQYRFQVLSRQNFRTTTRIFIALTKAHYCIIDTNKLGLVSCNGGHFSDKTWQACALGRRGNHNLFLRKHPRRLY